MAGSSRFVFRPCFTMACTFGRRCESSSGFKLADAIKDKVIAAGGADAWQRATGSVLGW